MNGQFRDSNNIGHNSRKSKKDRQYRDKKVWQKESDQQNT